MSSNYQEGDVVEVKIEKIVPRGLGLGFAEKLTVFVPLTVPGDVVSVSIRELKKRIAFAEIVEIKQPGPDRVTPPCRYFGTCGGCNFQQLSYASQLEAKVAILRDCLQRIGKIEYTGEIAVVPSPNEFAYRSRARLHLDRTEHTIGYLARHSHDVVDIESCPILTPAMNATLAEMRSGIEWNSFFNDRIEVEAAEGDDGVVSISSAEFAEPAEEVSSIIGGERFAYTAETFFQANRVVAEQFVAAATDGLSGGTAFDLYCGVGLFSLPLARQFKSVIGVEGNSRAIGFARRNAKNAGLTNVEFADRGVETFLSSQRLPKPDLILLDPPRSGTEKQTIPRVAEFRPANIVYVSCEPSILARDLRTLLDAGYGIESMTAFDLFPQTHHVETVVRLQKN